MAPRFLGKTSLADVQLLQIGGKPVLSEYPRIAALLRERMPQSADLIAEPVVTWGTPEAPGVVSWYADTQGEAEALTSVSTDRRQQIEQQLRAALTHLLPLLNDPAEGPLLQRVLHLADASGIKAVGGRALLTDWGMAPANATLPADLRAALATSPLGPYLAVDAAIPAPAATVVRPAAAARSPPPPPPPRPPLPIAVAERSVWNWWLVPAAFAVGGIFLVLGLWLGSRLLASNIVQPAPVSLFNEDAVRKAIEQQKQQNAALEHELQERQRALHVDVCRADPAQLPGFGPDRNATVPPVAVPTPPGGQQFHGSLAQLLRQAAVLVWVEDAEGHPKEMGSGFFITPQMVVTNHHVVEEQGAQIFVTNPVLGRATPVEVVATTPGDAETGQSDVALLRLEQPVHVQPLALATTVAPLDPVIAAGFPGLTMQGDEAFNRLRQGDASAVPEIILTDGKIEAIQTTGTNIQILPHTAPISGGNSGGPLVDACGRAVGINTFIVGDREEVAHVNYAQKIDSVAAFLAQHGSSVTPQTEPCAAAVAQAALPAQPQQSTPAPGVAPPAAPGVAPPAAAGAAPPAAAPGAVAPVQPGSASAGTPGAAPAQSPAAPAAHPTP